jgi:anthranilate synthase/aminodeoxychorismate synthase-like glutamine amidotransferase
MILLIDNYDSFVHNQARYLRRLGMETLVVRNDAVDVAAIRKLRPAAIVISPGPCTPAEAGCSMDVVRHLGNEIPILGVCLGHQAIAAALGGRIVRAPQPMHGRASAIEHSSSGLFQHLCSPLTVGRYHSLVIDPATLPTELEEISHTSDGVIMAVAHRAWPIWGVQFHPESILTEGGYQLLANFLSLAGLTPISPLPPTAHERPAAELEYTAPIRPVTF